MNIRIAIERPRLWALFCLLPLASCAIPPSIRTLEPGFTGERICRLEGNTLASGAASAAELRLELERRDSLGVAPRYALLLDVRGFDELRVRTSEPLTIVVDGDSSKLPRADSSAVRRVLDGEFISTRLGFEILPQQIHRLARGTTAGVELRGATLPVRGRLGPPAFAAVQKFLRECAVDSVAVADSAAAPDSAAARRR